MNEKSVQSIINITAVKRKLILVIGQVQRYKYYVITAKYYCSKMSNGILVTQGIIIGTIACASNITAAN